MELNKNCVNSTPYTNWRLKKKRLKSETAAPVNEDPKTEGDGDRNGDMDLCDVTKLNVVSNKEDCNVDVVTAMSDI